MCFDGASTVFERIRRDDPTLTVLNLSHMFMGNDGCKDLARALASNTKLVVLFLDNNRIGTSGIHALAQSLVRHPRLAHLCLGYNRINDDGCTSLAELLRENTSLRVVKLMSNMIGPKGGRLLAEALQHYKGNTLQHIELQNNFLDEQGVLAFCSALRHNTVLHSLDLRANLVRQQRCCHVTNAWLELLSDSNMTLHKLDLWDDDTPAYQAHKYRELSFWLEWNRAGRRSLLSHQSTDPVSIACLLVKATLSTSIVMATLQARPDMLDASLQAQLL